MAAAGRCLAYEKTVGGHQEIPDSAWRAATPAGPELPALKGEATASVVVVGAGFTGLSAALHLAEAGTDVIVIEAAEPGFGASGRTNGQVIPTLSKPDPDDIVARHGAAGERFVALLRDAGNDLFALIAKYELASEAEQTGWVQPAHTPGRIKISERRVAQWSKWGAPVELLDKAGIEAMTGSTYWHGGFWNRSGGTINGLAHCRALTRLLLAKGVKIFARSPATGFSRSGNQWRVTTEAGTVTAKAMILASGTYTGHFSRSFAPAIAHEVVPVVSWQMTTEPLGDNIRKTIIPGRQALSDTHGDLHFARYDARNQLISGGAMVFAHNGVERLKPMIAERLKKLWPQLGEVRFNHVWNGYIGMTRDYMPHIHQIGPDAFGWAGDNGRAVALSHAIGREMAKGVLGTPADRLALPFTAPTPLPFHGIARRLAPFMLIDYRRRDARELT